jgi:hypothetical protein
MSSDSDTNADFGKALDFVGPTVDKWTKELLKGFEVLNVSRPQKDLIQELTIETMLFNTLLPNKEIIAVLAGIIQKIATRHAYGNSLDWANREKLFQKYSKE